MKIEMLSEVQGASGHQLRVTTPAVGSPRVSGTPAIGAPRARKGLDEGSKPQALDGHWGHPSGLTTEELKASTASDCS